MDSTLLDATISGQSDLAMKRYSAFSKDPALLEAHHRIV